MKTITTLAFLILMTVSAAFGQNISGIYYGEYEGSKVACQLEQQGNTLAGVIQDSEGNVYAFQNQLNGGKTSGTMVVNQMYEFPYMAIFTGSGCKINISGAGGNTLSLSLARQTTSVSASTKTSPSPATKTASNIDASVVGRWIRQSRISSGSSSFTSVSYYQYNADGTYNISDGGASGSFESGMVSSGASGDIANGNWYVKDGNLYFTEDGKWYYKKYTMHNGKLVFGTNGNYTFLSRIN